MQTLIHDFTSRQYMITPDFEYFHYIDRSANEIEYHNHDFYEIFYFMSGNVTYMIEGKSYRLKPGDILLIHNNELHKPLVESGGVYERIVVWVNPDFLKKQSLYNTNLSLCFESSFPEKNNLIRPEPEMLDVLKDILAKFENACNSVSYGSNILKDIYLLEFIVYINKSFLQSFGDKLDEDIEYDEKVNNIIKYVNKNLNDDLSLDSLAQKFYLSKYHLLREFKKYTGYTIHQYIHQKRLIMAKSLLKEGMSVTEVCNRCGFGDYSNFIRAFKNAFGESPGKYFKD
ncbi:MAG TPA: AraC family transcriptional regulator [Clostridiales bacterium]|nr:AraC family transcriptional regulator [Clostridiales bacterium]